MDFGTINENDLPILTEVTGITSSQGVENLSIMEMVVSTKSRYITKMNKEDEAIRLSRKKSRINNIHKATQ